VPNLKSARQGDCQGRVREMLTRQSMPAATKTAIGLLLQSGCRAAAAPTPPCPTTHTPIILLAQVQLECTRQLARPPADEQHQRQGAVHTASWRQVDPSGEEAHGQLCQPVRRGGVESTRGQGITALHPGALSAVGGGVHPPLAHAPLIPGHSFFRLSALHCSLLVPKAKGDLSCPRLLPVITRPQLRRALVVNNPNYVGASLAAEGRVTATASNGAWGPIYVSGPSNNNTGAIGTGYNILLAGAVVLAMLCCSRLCQRLLVGEQSGDKFHLSPARRALHLCLPMLQGPTPSLRRCRAWIQACSSPPYSPTTWASTWAPPTPSCAPMPPR
jgi:hypothetical protein